MIAATRRPLFWPEMQRAGNSVGKCCIQIGRTVGSANATVLASHVLEAQAIVGKARPCTLEGKAGETISALTGESQLERWHGGPSPEAAPSKVQAAAAPARLQVEHVYTT